MVDIKTRCCGVVICSGVTHRRAVHGAMWEKVSLAYADLSRLDLTNLFLRDADLRGADLGWANFQGACLRGVKLDGANIFGARFHKADLRNITWGDIVIPREHRVGAKLEIFRRFQWLR